MGRNTRDSSFLDNPKLNYIIYVEFTIFLIIYFILEWPTRTLLSQDLIWYLSNDFGPFWNIWSKIILLILVFGFSSLWYLFRIDKIKKFCELILFLGLLILMFFIMNDYLWKIQFNDLPTVFHRAGLLIVYLLLIAGALFAIIKIPSIAFN